MKNRFVQLTSNLFKACRHYAFVLLSALLFTGTVIQMTSAITTSYFNTKLALISSLGIGLFFALSIMGQRYGKSLLFNSSGVVLLGLLWLIIFPKNEVDFNDHYVYTFALLYLLVHLLVALAPYLTHSADSFWQYNKKLFINTFLTVVFSMVLAGGLELAVAAIDHLFVLNFDDDIYLNLFWIALIFGSALIFCLFNADGLTGLIQEEKFPKTLKFFTQFILIPLLFTYTVILYLYGAKIAITWHLPQGWVAYLVLTYGVIGTLALLLIYPLTTSKAKMWVHYYKRLFFYILLPLLVLLFVAIGVRIHAYGLTEGRYLVVALGVWFSFISLYFICIRQPQLRHIPYSMFVLGILVLLMPYFNLYAWSLRSQKQRFHRILVENNLLEEGKINFDQPISSEVISNLSSKHHYLQEHGQVDFLTALIAPKDTMRYHRRGFYRLFETPIPSPRTSQRISFKAQPPFDLENYQYLIPLNNYNLIDSVIIHQDTLVIQRQLYGDSPQFSFRLNDAHKNLYPLFEQKAQTAFAEKRLKNTGFSTNFPLGNYQLKVIFGELNLSYSPKTQLQSVHYDNGFVLINTTRTKNSKNSPKPTE